MNTTYEDMTTLFMNTSSIIFASQYTWTIYAYFTGIMINFILGLPTNSYVLWLIFTEKGCGVGSDFFILNLAVCEIVYCLGSVIGVAITFCLLSSRFLSFISVLPIIGRCLFLCLICVERYIAVVHPVTFLKFKPLRYRLACSTIVWVIVLIFGVFCMFAMPSNNTVLFLYVVLPQYSLLLVIKMFCCLAVLRALKYPGPGEKGRQREEANLIKKRAMSIIVKITVAMIFNYVPLLLAGFLYGSLTMSDFTTLWTISVEISMLVGYVKPFLYIQRFGNLSKDFRMIINAISLTL